jgi:lipopolysaccharide/colanic/teichoic acid biosynthesis glycosyltransferase
MYKFRSMCMNADALLAQLQAQNEMTGPTFKMENDPRITKVGRVIRRTSIDELPQLVNVLKGDMTIIGPRPPIASEVESYNDYQKQRLLVKTGLACYHECRGRSTIKDFDRWVEMDLEYIQERGLWTDVKIILKTIVVVLSRKGAE